eukprot:2514587-Amphidinium_carterae.1
MKAQHMVAHVARWLSIRSFISVTSLVLLVMWSVFAIWNKWGTLLESVSSECRSRKLTNNCGSQLFHASHKGIQGGVSYVRLEWFACLDWGFRVHARSGTTQDWSQQCMFELGFTSSQKLFFFIVTLKPSLPAVLGGKCGRFLCGSSFVGRVVYLVMGCGTGTVLKDAEPQILR